MNSFPAVLPNDRVLGALWGSMVGDALGVPVEFRTRAEVQKDPVTGMRAYGSHRQPKGAWSDDGALILCTVDSLVNSEFDTRDMADRFVRWMNEELWTATGVVFDIGNATTDALMQIAKGTPAETAGRRDESSNGNGSLMRIIPIALRFAGESVGAFSARIKRVSAITHGHERAKMACVFYSLVIRNLLFDLKPETALDAARAEFAGLYGRATEFECFRRHLADDFRSILQDDVVSTGICAAHPARWFVVFA
jgi:ADP-ribosylglycohydrolase